MLAETNKRRMYMISSSLEEYLKTIYVLKKQGQDIKVTTIANRMNCTKPSVNKAIKNLKANEMLEYEAYGEIRLTNKGEALAKKVLEAYDIVYVFLTEILEIPKEEAKEEAIRLKAVMNDNTLNMLTKYVYKILGVYNLNCNYDINEEKCRCCNRKILNLKREENIDE
jgi:DtxR family Mn-dependent transcriptional regulator